MWIVCGDTPGQTLREACVFTPAGQPDVGIRVHEELHVKHVPYFLWVEDQDPLEEDDVRWVKCDLLLQPITMHGVNDKKSPGGSELHAAEVCFYLE